MAGELSMAYTISVLIDQCAHIVKKEKGLAYAKPFSPIPAPKKKKTYPKEEKVYREQL